MKVLLIPDKFKGSLTAKEVILAVSKGIRKVHPDAEIHSILASDGGDGFLDTIMENRACEIIKGETLDPLGRKIISEYLFDPESNSAYIELAKASGLELLLHDERDVRQTSTFGTGLQIKDAILKGATTVYVGLGGSATNDAGLGIAQALDYYFLDKDGNQLEPTGGNLTKINSIHKKSTSLSLKGISIFAVNDVNNPLYGKHGAAYVYAKQKGADAKTIKELDEGLKNLSKIVKSQTKKDVADLNGSGAAGGTAYGLKVFCDAEFILGIDFVMDKSNTEKLLSKTNFDLIVTGEGKIDKQTLHGKLISGVIELGNRFEVPVLAICGRLDLEQKAHANFSSIDILEVSNHSKSMVYNMENANELIGDSIVKYFRKYESI